MRTGFERHRERVDGKHRANCTRLIHRHLKCAVRHCTAIRVTGPTDEVVVFGRDRDEREVRAVRHPASLRRGDGSVLRLGRLKPPVRREDVPGKLNAIRHSNRELVRHDGVGERRAKRDHLHTVRIPRLRRGERHIGLVIVLRRLAVHRHVELSMFPVGRHFGP